MFNLNQTQAFKQYLKNREEAIESEKIADDNTSRLYNEKHFYKTFVRDLYSAKREVIIYSPFITKFRSNYYKNIFEKIRRKNIEVFIFTRPVEEYDSIIRPQIENILERFEELGICVFFPGKYIHGKTAIIDREILWEGSLNILAHNASNEMMRRTQSEESAMEVMNCLGLNSRMAEAYKVKYEIMYQSLIGFSKSYTKQKIIFLAIGLSISTIIWWIFSIVGGMIQ